jgi:hypothetical protein
MSLAMFAAPFDDNIESFTNNQDNNIINKKRQSHNRTQKMYTKENFDSSKVNSVLEKIHGNIDDEDDKDTFSPPPKAESAGVQKTVQKQNATESMINMNINSNTNTDSMFRTLGRAPQPNYEGSDNLDLNNYNNYGDNKSNEEYYKRVLPGYIAQKNVVNKPYYNNVSFRDNISETQNPDILIQKLNYMITLLEDQQDEKTNNVTEEVVLYSFLGIFIIFIADTFVRVGKYVR